MSLTRLSLLPLCCLLPLLWPCHAPGKSYQGVLEDPVTLGAWLFKSSCSRCHTDYAQERLAGEYGSEAELVEAIADEGCEIAWARKAGGTLNTGELKALAAYMLQWEAEGSAPQLPDLPPLPEENSKKVAHPKKKTKQKTVFKAIEEPGLDPALHQVVATNTIARGGWLYTNNCYRCHLSYTKARMGRGLAMETVQRFISEGKTSTQMQPFSRMLGGNLKNSEIKSIVAYIAGWEKAGEPLAIAAALMTPPSLDPTDFLPIRLPRFNPVQGDVAAGADLFRNNCSRCHGSTGQGYTGPSLQERRWGIRADLFVKAVIKQGVPGSLMPAWDRTKGGTFTAKDIGDVVSLVMTMETVAQPLHATAQSPIRSNTRMNK